MSDAWNIARFSENITFFVSQWNAYHGPSNARLFFTARRGKTGAWSSKINAKSQWIQVDLREKFLVTKMATQGRQDHAQWVTQYKVSYSTDGKIFTAQSKVSKCKGKVLFHFSFTTSQFIMCVLPP